VRYSCIHRRRYQHSIRMMCRLLKVSRSGYYDWNTRAQSARSVSNQQLTRIVKQLHLDSNGVYGARKIHRDLLELGEPCGRHRVARIMRKVGLKGCPKRRFRRYANSPPSHPVADNLLEQDFKATRMDERWSSDITYLWTRQGWLFLAVVMDLFSRRIVGWSMNKLISRHLVIDAMAMALDQRDKPQLHHSDRGSEYTSDDFRDLLKKHGIECSMSGRGNCYDNAPVESFFSSLKRERVRRQTYKTRDEAKADVFDYIECFYNRKRRHSTLGYISPVEFENRSLELN
jgi:putative transposase